MSEVDGTIDALKRHIKEVYGVDVIDSSVLLVVEEIVKERRLAETKRILSQYSSDKLVRWLSEQQNKINTRNVQSVICAGNESTPQSPVVEVARKLGRNKSSK